MTNNKTTDELNTSIFDFISRNPGTIMKDFYSNFQDTGKSSLDNILKELIESGTVKKIKEGRTVKLYAIAKSPHRYLKKLEKQVEDVTPNKVCNYDNISMPEWYISVYFKKSTYKNYLKAVDLAKSALKYEEKITDDLAHHSLYSKDQNSFLNFINLYKLIKDWNSCYIEINDKISTKKSLDLLTECYCEKCKISEKGDFCLGTLLVQLILLAATN
ncbi:hypothetical protein [Clostridium thailandense]|uniref:hypothetical protein n=1 Tax=Clostridium thailandense TaxID=2794346 RepID=UPI0039890D60